MRSEPTPPPEVVCRGLAKTFASGTEAVAPLDLTFDAGQTTALVGPSGCGKSTVLRLVAGLEEPSSGKIEIGGLPPAETLRKAGLSVAFQDPSLLPWRSVRGNIELALGLARRPVRTQDIDQLVTLVGLEGFADVRPAELSGGMRPRAARMIADISVDLPRPRGSGLAREAEFVRLTDEVFAALTRGMATDRTSLAAQ